MRSFGPYILHAVLVSSVFLSYLSPALSFLLCLSLSSSKAQCGGAGHHHSLRRLARLRGDCDTEVLCPHALVFACPASSRRCPIATPSAPAPPRPGAALSTWGWARPSAAPSLPPSASMPPCLGAALSPVGSGPPRCRPTPAPPPPQRCPVCHAVRPATPFSMLEGYWEGSCDSTA
jgi:hypothetical protein